MNPAHRLSPRLLTLFAQLCGWLLTATALVAQPATGATTYPTRSNTAATVGTTPIVDFDGEFRLTRYASLFPQGRNVFNGGQTWMWTPPGNVGGQGAAVLIYENYGANWNFGIKGTF